MLRSIQKFFRQGDIRTVQAKRNIVISFLAKGAGILISLISVPLILSYIGAPQYGVWLTLSSIISWFNFFDIGLGNGLKNKLAEEGAESTNVMSRTYVSTTYGLLAIVSMVALIVFFAVNRFLPWSSILNIGSPSPESLHEITLIVFSVFCVQFVLQLINSILLAKHDAGQMSLMSFGSQAFSVVSIFLLLKLTAPSLTNLILVLTLVPVLVQLGCSIYYFNNKYQEISPHPKYIDFRYSKALLAVGGDFFLIQLAALVLFQTNNIIVAQLFGPEMVTVFNISYKLFSVIIILFTIINTPLWSAFTDAYVKRDFDWINRVFSKMYRFFFLLSILTLLLLLFSDFIYTSWVGDSVNIPLNVSIGMALYVIAFSWQTIHVYFLNGIGKIRLQLYLVLCSAVVNVPLAVLLSKFFGLVGVILSNAILFSAMGTIFFLQSKKILANRAKGLWAK